MDGSTIDDRSTPHPPHQILNASDPLKIFAQDLARDLTDKTNYQENICVVRAVVVKTKRRRSDQLFSKMLRHGWFNNR